MQVAVLTHSGGSVEEVEEEKSSWLAKDGRG